MKNNKYIPLAVILALIVIIGYLFQDYSKKTESLKITHKTEIRQLTEQKTKLEETVKTFSEKVAKLEAENSKLKKSSKIIARKYYPNGQLKSEFKKSDKEESESSKISQDNKDTNSLDSTTKIDDQKSNLLEIKEDIKIEQKKEDVKKSNTKGFILIGIGVILAIFGIPVIF